MHLIRKEERPPLKREFQHFKNVYHCIKINPATGDHIQGAPMPVPTPDKWGGLHQEGHLE